MLDSKGGEWLNEGLKFCLRERLPVIQSAPMLHTHPYYCPLEVAPPTEQK